jgi:O-acetylhomoserine (thiol)-lyase
LGITTSFVDPSDASNFAKRQRKYEGVLQRVWEIKIRRFGFKAISAEAKKNESSFYCDNTVPSPYSLNPIQYGADIVIHSLTKYIAGNGLHLEV